MDVFQQLAAPFSPDAVSWRAQSVTRDGSKAMALAYIDARDVMERLDSVVGPANWQDTYAETPKGRLICTLSLRIEGEWISKSDGAGDTDVEGDKGAISDALKRAAVKWGIGRYLYDIKAPWADCESYEKNGKKMWKAWTPTGLRKLQQFLPRPDAANVTPIVQPAALSEEPQLPDSVNAMMKGLEAAMHRGSDEMASYWTQHWPAVPKDYRAQVLAFKEELKARNDNVNLMRAG